jgi:hypothetical protein
VRRRHAGSAASYGGSCNARLDGRKTEKLRKNPKEQFVGIPHWVMRHPAFRDASHRARALLFDVALQYNGRNNGKLVVCDKVMKPLGWNSRDGLCKAKQELLTLGLLIETRRGAKPNKAAWYALSWRALDVAHGLDLNPRSYVTLIWQKSEPDGRHLVAHTTKVRPPQDGLVPSTIRPPHGLRDAPPRPPHGRMEGQSGTPSRPPHGQYIDVAIPGARRKGANHD